MKHLIIAEKSSAGKDIAKILGMNDDNIKNGYMENNCYIVAWARGHLVGLKQAKEIYGDKNAWDLNTIPYDIDIDNELKVLSETGSYKIFNTLKELINRLDVDYIINAGDSGREGELIQRWIYKMANNKKEVKRLWTSSLTDEAIKKALNNLRKSDEFDNIYNEAKALKYVDWLYGMNYTVAMTKIYGSGKLLPYGRCQTPLINLIIERENEIKNFKKEKYYNLVAKYDIFKGILYDKKTNENISYKMKDEIPKIDNRTAIIESIEEETKETKAPKMFSLMTLQQSIGKTYNYTPEETLEIAQSLYEKKLTTYPRTNSEYLSTEIYKEIMKHINSCKDIDVFKGLNFDFQKELTKEYVNDNKIEDHHCIIPTEIKADLSLLTEKERNIYIEICKRFLAVFMNNYVYKQKTIITKIDNYYFRTQVIKISDIGFRGLYKDINDENELDELNEEYKINDKIQVKEFETKEIETKPKQRYNVSTIIKVMKQYGIGTPATMSEIIKKTLNSKMIQLIEIGKNKEYVPTELAIQYINLIPLKLKSCNLTKSIEEKIECVKNNKTTLFDFQKNIFEELKNTISELKKNDNKNFSFSLSERETVGKCPFCNNEIVEYEKSYSHKDFKNSKCDFVIWKNISNKRITKQIVKEILENKKTKKIKGFKNKNGKEYEAILILNEETKKIEIKFN